MRLKVSNVCQVFNKEEFIATTTRDGITFTNNGDGTFTINGTATANVFIELFKSGTEITGFNINHKYLICGNLSNAIQIFETLSGNGTRHYEDSIFTCVRSKGYLDLRIVVGTTATNYVFRPQLFDLTEMYGIGNEPTTVEQFRQDFPNEMYDYSPECWKKFRRLKYVTETKNLFDVNKITELTNLKNNKDGTITVSVYGVSGGLLKNLCPELKVGDVIKVYFQPLRWTASKPPLVINAGGVIFDRNGNSTLTVTEESLNQPVYFYNNDYGERELPGITIIGNILITTDLTITNENYNVRYTPYGYLPLRSGKYIANKEPVQLLDKSKFSATTTTHKVTFTNNGDGTVTVNGTNNDEIYYNLEMITSIPVEHKVIIDDRNSTLYFFGDMRTKDNVLIGTIPPRTIFTLPSNLALLNMLYYVRYNSSLGVGQTYNNELSKPQLFDLTAMYGAGNEPTTVEQFRADFPNELYDYNPYNAITFR